MSVCTRNDLAYNFAQDLKAVLKENKSISQEVVDRALCQFKHVCKDLSKRVKCYLADKEPCFDGPCKLKHSGYEFMLP